MRALLHNLRLELTTNDRRIQGGWQTVFDLEIEAAAQPDSSDPDIRLAAAVTSHLPSLPAGFPSYTEPSSAEQQLTARYYKTENGGILVLARPAQIAFDFSGGKAEIHLTRDLLDAGNLEDLSLIALAPFLRRCGYFLLHGFATAKVAASKETAVLLCGPPGSGKTTAGLALLEKGWRYLANDAALLGEEKGQVWTYPSPGAINLHPHTISMLPEYGDRFDRANYPMNGGKYTLARGKILEDRERGGPTAVGFILFPRIVMQDEHSLHEVSPAVGLARLIEENVDQWDQETCIAHIDHLTRLSRQASFYDLHFPRDQAPGSDFLKSLYTI